MCGGLVGGKWRSASYELGIEQLRSASCQLAQMCSMMKMTQAAVASSCHRRLRALRSPSLILDFWIDRVGFKES